jgi:phosphoketolase
MKLNMEARNFRLFSPDENNSNRWQDVLEVTNRCYMAEIYPEDDRLSPDGRVMEVLSEHQCQLSLWKRKERSLRSAATKRSYLHLLKVLVRTEV